MRCITPAVCLLQSINHTNHSFIVLSYTDHTSCALTGSQKLFCWPSRLAASMAFVIATRNCNLVDIVVSLCCWTGLRIAFEIVRMFLTALITDLPEISIRSRYSHSLSQSWDTAYRSMYYMQDSLAVLRAMMYQTTERPWSDWANILNFCETDSVTPTVAIAPVTGKQSRLK